MPGPTRGQLQRSRILDAAIDLASTQGLGPLSIGRLAEETSLSKSGVYAHFGSKEELQLGAIDAASASFEGRVVTATAEVESGRARLEALVEAWIHHVEASPLRGGCFFFATSAEFSSQPGPVRERLAERTGAWLAILEREARTAKRLGEISGRPRDLVFRLHAFVQEANWMRQLFDDPSAFERARQAVRETIAFAAPVQAADTRHDVPSHPQGERR